MHSPEVANIVLPAVRDSPQTSGCRRVAPPAFAIDEAAARTVERAAFPYHGNIQKQNEIAVRD